MFESNWKYVTTMDFLDKMKGKWGDRQVQNQTSG
jgi:hypothetical protein